ncbi:hypothetical protein GCM10025864_06790 [Luteimicrobium album]|uniref:Uncharacterized protein n=1 Tax=Luteimicrobium album TaxID=1054550 RepID=A0ABQ6HZG7_9MICO|nr:hypothetical protein GCM10025864_06790 [Luteimicrobium album]
MHAHRPRALRRAQRGEGRGRRVALGGRYRVDAGPGEQVAEEALAARPHEDRQTECLEHVEVGEERPVVHTGLREAEAWVEHDLAGVHPRPDEGVDACGELVADVEDHVVVVGVGVHDVGVPAPVHDDEDGARVRDDPRHRGVREPARHVVHDPGSGLEGTLGDTRPCGVDAHGRACGRERLDHRQDPAQLLGLVDPDGARAGGLAAHVEQVRAVREQLVPVGDRRVRLEPLAPVRERVRRHVDHAQHERAVQRRQRGRQRETRGGRVEH